MDINTLTIGEARQKLEEATQTVAELSALFGQASAATTEPEKLSDPIPVLVCTDKRAVVFGYTDQPHADPLPLTNARMSLYWSKTTGGVFGLAEQGPNAGCRTSALVDAVTLVGITAVFSVSSVAESAWIKAPVQGRD